MELVVSFILRNTLLFLLIAIGGNIGAVMAAQRGKRGLAKGLAWSALIASCLMTAIYAALAFWGAGMINLLLAALWGWFASRDWRIIKQLG